MHRHGSSREVDALPSEREAFALEADVAVQGDQDLGAQRLRAGCQESFRFFGFQKTKTLFWFLGLRNTCDGIFAFEQLPFVHPIVQIFENRQLSIHPDTDPGLDSALARPFDKKRRNLTKTFPLNDSAKRRRPSLYERTLCGFLLAIAQSSGDFAGDVLTDESPEALAIDPAFPIAAAVSLANSVATSIHFTLTSLLRRMR